MEGIPVFLKRVVLIADESVALQQQGIVLPLIEDVIAFLRLTDRIQHVAVALGVQRLLKRLDRQTEIDLVGGDVGGDVGKVGRLQGIEEDQEGEDLVVGGLLRLA